MAGLAGVAAGIGLGGGLLNNINGSSGFSNASDIGHSEGVQDSNSWSYGQSASQAYSNMDAWSQANSFQDSWDESENRSWGSSNSYGYNNSDAYAENYGRTYGREASAQDIQNAAEANQIQRDLWSMQADYNAKEAQKSREWSQYMTDTYYQRLVNDLKLAGLNPILALSGYGASTPTGATATTGLASAAKANAYAESTSGGYSRSTGRSENWSSSENGSYGWSKGGSHGESQSRSQSTERSQSSSSSSERSGSKSHANNVSDNVSSSHSETTNNIKQLAEKGVSVTKQAIGALQNIYYGNKNSAKGSHSY